VMHTRFLGWCILGAQEQALGPESRGGGAAPATTRPETARRTYGSVAWSHGRTVVA
jgi:hypothetical protein